MRVAALASLLAMAPLTAQTFVVGPGGAFPDIQSAVTAVPDGSVLDVLPGSYGSFTIDGKGLTVLGGPGVVVDDFALVVAVRNLQPTQRVVLHGLELRSTIGDGFLRLADNQGPVVLDNCGTASLAGLGCVLEVADCADVRLHECALRSQSLALLDVRDSAVRVAAGSFDAGALQPSMPVIASTLELVDVAVAGSVYAPAFTLQNGAVRALGSTTVTTFNTPAFAGAGSVRLTPSVALQTGAAPAFGPGVTATFVDMPSVTGTVTAAGAGTGQLVGPTNGYGWLFVGLHGPLVQLPGFEPVTILPGSEVLLVQGPLVVTLAATYPAPPLPGALGMTVSWQGVSFDPVNGLQLSNGVAAVHR